MKDLINFMLMLAQKLALQGKRDEAIRMKHEAERLEQRLEKLSKWM